jgi:hypothetical protein
MATSIYQRIEYRGDTWLLKQTPFALLVLLLGLFILLYDDSDRRHGAWILVATGAGWIAFMLYRRFHPSKPTVALSPRGLAMRLDLNRDLLIPWREISDVSAVTFKEWDSTSRWPFRSTFRDITAVTVSKGFYERHILVSPRIRRGPMWNVLYRPRGDAMHVLLHHKDLSVPADELRNAVDARWRAFSGRPDLEPSRDESGPAPAGGLYGGPAIAAGEMVWTPWQLIKFAVPLAAIVVVLANAARIWETPEQVEARLERARVAEEERLEALERHRQKMKWEQFWKDVDRDFRRP